MFVCVREREMRVCEREKERECECVHEEPPHTSMCQWSAGLDYLPCVAYKCVRTQVLWS